MRSLLFILLTSLYSHTLTSFYPPDRNWIRTDLIPIAQANPDLSIKTEIKRCKHPYFRGVYANGNTKTIGVKNLEVEDLAAYFEDLRNQVGRKVSLFATYDYYLCVTSIYL
jgi:hypothetical protein